MIGNRISPFKFWCQKVLPTVYDDSLSYYEVLNKVTEFLNQVIEQMNTLTENVEDYEENLTGEWNTYKTELTSEWTTYRDELTAVWEQYKTYIDNYFNNLDVQEEINNKLDEMASDGTLDTLLLPYFNAYKTEINGMVGTQNNRITVLENRMDTFASLPDGSTSGDAELLDIRVPQSGFNGNQDYSSAGDAVRGQVLALKNMITNNGNADEYIIGNDLTWESGLYNLYTGLPTDNNSWKRTQKINYNVLPIIELGNFDESWTIATICMFWNNDVFLGCYNYTNETYYDTAYTSTTKITGYNTVALMMQTTVGNTYLNTIKIYSLKTVDNDVNNIIRNINNTNNELFENISWDSGLWNVTTGVETANANWLHTTKYAYPWLPVINDTAELFDYSLIACLWYDDLFVGTYNYADGKWRDNTYTEVDNPILFNKWALDANSYIQLSPLAALPNRTLVFNAKNVLNNVLRNKRSRKLFGTPTKFTFGCIGDSLTLGVLGPTSNVGTSYAEYLSQKIGNSHYALIATAGASAQYILNTWMPVVSMAQYNFVTIMLGTNGYLEGDFNTEKDNPNSQIYAYCKIIEKCINDTAGQCKILLLNPPDTGDNVRTTDIKNHIHVNVEKIADYYGLPVLDLKYASMLDPTDETLYNQDDKVHLTNKGYEIVADMIYDYIVDNYGTMTCAKQYVIPTT